MAPAQVLEIAAHAVTAALALWLGLIVATRSRTSAARVFGVLAMSIVAWSGAILVQRLADPVAAARVARGVEELAAAAAIASLLALAAIIAGEDRITGRRGLLVGCAYLVNLLVVLPTALDPAISPPQLAMAGGPAALFGWTWIGVRIVSLLTAALWLVQARSSVRGDALRRRQLRAAGAVVGLGALGASMRMLPVIGEADAWIGTWVITLAVVAAAYAVLATGVFVGGAAVGQAFWATLWGGAAVLAVLGVVSLLDAAGRQLLGIDVPLFTGLGMVALIALYEPLSRAVRGRAARLGLRSDRMDSVLRGLGESTLVARPSLAGVEPALARLRQALGAESVRLRAVEDPATRADEPPGVQRSSVVRVALDDGAAGELEVHLPPGSTVDATTERLVELAARYLTTAIRTGRTEDEQARSLALLAEARATVEDDARTLHRAIADGLPSVQLHVLALGPMRVERDGSPIERWGGDKAGSRQAQAVFAFLFDRGERGVTKDEVLELVWPDVDVQKADAAFHRTLVGLRRTLETGRGGSPSIRFHHDRYRLDPSIIGACDAWEFDERVTTATAAGPEDAPELLEAARRLYRGDYLDDCPYYGDSVHVEDRRVVLRAQLVDILISLGEAYERGGDRIRAAAAYREALTRSEAECAPAADGLSRLQARSTV